MEKPCAKRIPRQLQKAGIIFLRDFLICTAVLGSTLGAECQPALPTLVAAQVRGSKPVQGGWKGREGSSLEAHLL